MVSLRERDLRAVLNLVGEVHHAEDLGVFRAALLDGLPRVVPADFVSYNEVPHDPDGELVAIVVPDVPAWAYEVWGRYGMQNPLVQRHLATRDGRAYRFSDVISRDELRKLELYVEIYARLGVEHQLAACLPSPEPMTIAFVLSRGGRDFTERDRRLIDLGRPHLIQAYRNAELRERTRRILDGLQAGIDDLGHALVVLDAGDRVALATAAAQRVMDAAAGWSGAPGSRLPAPVAAWLAAGARVPLILDTDRSLTVRHVPARGDTPRVLLFERGTTMIDPSVLRGLGLTPRQADVLHQIVLGRSTEEVAAALSIRPRTVHKHLEHVFATLGVTSRTEAVATVWAAVGVGDRR